MRKQLYVPAVLLLTFCMFFGAACGDDPIDPIDPVSSASDAGSSTDAVSSTDAGETSSVGGGSSTVSSSGGKSSSDSGTSSVGGTSSTVSTGGASSTVSSSVSSSGGGSSTVSSSGGTSSAVSSSAPGVSSSGGGVPGTGFQENMSLPQNVRDYYRSAYGLSGSALKAQLKSIITSGHSGQGYGGLWTMYKTSDVVPAGVANAGKLWDMYSNTSVDGSTAAYWYTVGSNQCGNYSGERSCYNREHTWPKSNWGGSDSNTPGTDGHHITPTDGYVNGRRGNEAYGEVGTATWTSENGGKLGSARSGLGFSGTVFEVIDIYKGDHARMHFYTSVRYYGDSLFQSGDWSNSGAKLKPWYNTMLRAWHASDPLHQKEITRNNAVHAWQGNRNPFIDYPELVDLIDFTN